MTIDNHKLESGQEYTLKTIFSGKNRIIIPDLQRDYCWGDKAWDKDSKQFKELISGFMDSLISSFKEKPKEKLTLGLIYGYENPHFSIQLCDGQQRLTTLFLLLGMIYRETKDNDLKTLLISDKELQDDKEPNLLYAIRESTLYFVSDLVCDFFLKKEVKIEDIKTSEWYFKEYDLDASIQSMINAIKIIETKLKEISDYSGFGNFIANNLQMLYYDMGHRTRGEETFVVINTTGEPLTATENLKPILIGNIEDNKKREKASKEWEDREEWFWQNRAINVQTSDDALKDFFIWYWQIRLLQEKSWKDKKSYTINPNELFQKRPLTTEDQEENPSIDKWEESKNLVTVHEYFTALVKLVDTCKENKEIIKVLKSIKDEEISHKWFRTVSLDVILPLIAYVKILGDKNLYSFIRRIRKNFFDNKWSERKNNYVDWRHIIQIIELCKKENEDVLNYETILNKDKFKSISNVPLNKWYNNEEAIKYKLKEKYRDKIEEWEDHPDFMGDLSFLIGIDDDIKALNPNEHFKTEELFKKLKLFYKNYEATFDLIRTEDKAKTQPILANYFRLVRMFASDSVDNTHKSIWVTARLKFSEYNRLHLENKNIAQKYKGLLSCDGDQTKLIVLCKDYISGKQGKLKELNILLDKEKPFPVDEAEFQIRKFLYSWMTLKVYNAEMVHEKCATEEVLISYWKGTGAVAAYYQKNDNRLTDEFDFCLENSKCGRSLTRANSGREHVEYVTNDERYLLKPFVINTPFAGFEDGKSDEEKIKENKKRIDQIIDFINSGVNPL